MEVRASSRTPRQFKSVSLRTNEEFVRLYNNVTEARRLVVSRPRVVGHDQDYLGHCSIEFARAGRRWKYFQDQIWDVDQRMKRVEKYALLSEVLAGIVLRFEQEIFRILRRFHLFFGNKGLGLFGLWLGFFPIFEKYDLQGLLDVFADSVSSGLESAHKVVVSALALLSFVYQYLIGCVGKGGSKTYSPGSSLFRLIFVAIVLFLGSYVWIKFRQASYTASRRKRKLGDESDVPEGVYRRAVKDASGSVTHYKYEPRFKPRREKLETGTTLEFNYLPLGSYDTPREAQIVRHIAAVLYGKEEVRPVQFEDGILLPFPSVTESKNCPPCGKEKADWVTRKTKQLYAQLSEESKARRLQRLPPAVETGSHHGHDGEARRGDPSPSSPGAPSTAIELTCFTSRHGGNGVREEWATSECHGLGQEPPLAPVVFSPFLSQSDLDQIFRSCAQGEENDLLAMADPNKAEGDCSETDRVFGSESTSVPPQPSALDIPTSAFSASLPELDVGDQDLEIIEPQLNSATAITFQQLESLPEQVQLQLRMTCQERRPEELSGSNVELQQRLLESEVRISELQQRLHQSEVENEKWRSMFRELAKLI